VANELLGKTALVTGSGRNIGRAIVLELASMGANVIINARSNRDEAEAVAKEAADLGTGAAIIMGDVSKQETIDAFKREAEERFGRVDIVVSNAATRPVQSFFEMTTDDFKDQLEIQLIASFRLAKAFVPGMVEQRWGRIIHITGPDAFVGFPNRAHNVVAKGGLRALTKALALELGEFGVTVNDVAPGATNVIRAEASHPRVGQSDVGRLPATGFRPTSSQDPIQGLIDAIPVGRMGEPEEVAYAVGFLASPRAAFYTGTVMCCFGGHWLPA
jgi:3-oxoacyl-[acyl-carrier protein] reductase